MKKCLCKTGKNQNHFVSVTKCAGKEGHLFPLVGKAVARGAGCVNRWYGRTGKEEEATQWGGDKISQLLYLPLRDKAHLFPR